MNDITYIKVQFCQQVAKSVKVDGVQEIQKSLIVRAYIYNIFSIMKRYMSNDKYFPDYNLH